MTTNRLELFRKSKGMGMSEFAKWLGLHHNTYKKIINKQQKAIIYIQPFVVINQKTGLALNDIWPEHPILKLIKK